MQLVEFVIEEKEDEEKEKTEVRHLEKALEKCGYDCIQDFEDAWNVWD